jgi:hypothetical protein
MGMAPHNKAAAQQRNQSQEAHVKAVLARANLERDRRVLALDNSIHLLIKIYLNEWKEAMDTVITDAKSPEDEKSRFYWFVALAGNVLWAATCLVPAGGAVAAGAAAVEAAARAQRAIKIMSFGGAIVGSGTAEQIFGNRGNASGNLKIQIGTTIQQFTATGDPAADGKTIARLVLAAKRDELEDLFKSQEKQWALDVNDAAEGGFDVKEVMDTFVWQQLFPRIPYKGKHQSMYQSGLTSVNGALADYSKQWKDWQFRKERSKPYWKHRRMYGEYWDYSVPDPGDFKPQLKFDLLT